MGATKIRSSAQLNIDANLDAQTHKIINVTDPTAAQDAATKNYVDGLINGLDWKQAVRLATTANGTLASAFANGQTIDGVALVTGDRILLKNQTTGSENGLYTVNASGAPTRSADANTSALFGVNLTVMVEEGTVNADTQWTCTNNAAITLGTTSLTFAQIGAGTTYTAADASIVISGTTIKVATGTTGQVFIGNGSGIATPVTMSGDATIIASGALTVASTVAKYAKFIVRETPSGTLNGSNVTFTLANTPQSGTEMLFMNGQLLEPGGGNDYTISGGTITTVMAPISTDRLRCTYISS